MDQPAEPSGPVLVGVCPGQPLPVVQEAARLAAALDRPLLCAYVTADSYLTEWDRAALRDDASLHPGPLDEEDGQHALHLARAIDEVAAGAGAAWTLRVLGGDPPHALMRLADEADARLVVVGTRRRGPGHAVESWLAGSVGTRIAHDQTRPVVVVPVLGYRGPTLT
ncbi:universal stress protein [Leifsonia sp. F6_8S_P_1B]|uniref:Universal stress protein n=1 Tax=Leifsonia williamsii TaxID=3035919 RepID=A0ABT8KCW3_9MICO|nr:universal stress protein [Leifsonia williamsii]MDN4615303.1 universal stress protein [Leifsonia williamsii]